MLMHRTDRLPTQCSPVRRRLQGLVALGLLALAVGAWGAPAAWAQDADDSRSLLVERERLLAQMAEMRAALESMQGSLDVAHSRSESAQLDARQSAEVAAALQLEQQALATDAFSRSARLAEVTANEARVRDAASTASLRAYLAAAGGTAAEDAQHLARNAQTAQTAQATQTAPDTTLDSATLDLVTRSIQLQGELRIAQLEIAQTQALRAKDLVSEFQVRQAEVQFETQQRMSELLAILLSAEVEATQADLEHAARALAAAPDQGRGRLLRLEARLKILRSALQPGHGAALPEEPHGAR